MNCTKPKILAKVEWTIEHILRWIHEGLVSWVREAYLRVELTNLFLVCCRPQPVGFIESCISIG